MLVSFVNAGFLICGYTLLDNTLGYHVTPEAPSPIAADPALGE